MSAVLPADGQYTIELIATGIDISAVGRGTIVATSPGTTDPSNPLPSASTVDGTISINGGRPLALSKGSTSQTLGGSPSPSSPSSPSPKATPGEPSGR